MLAIYLLLAAFFTSTVGVHAQTATPMPTPNYALQLTLMPPPGESIGQDAAIDFVVTVGDLGIAVILMALLFTLWAFFLFMVFVERRR